MQYAEFMEAGYRIFGLYGADKAGRCMCGNPHCNAILKHPVASNWQHTPQWSGEQIEVMEITGQLATGYGVLVADGLLVVDVDARNGGVQSYARLLELVPEVAGAGLIVETGSGGGSQHLYFRIPANMALAQHHDDYRGIDFKSSGFVVGPGSLHASGRRYEAVVGSPYDIDLAPDQLLALLQKPDRVRKQVSGVAVDLSFADLTQMVMSIPNSADVGHEVYIRIGMGIHDATDGSLEGLALWEQWAAQSPRYKKNGSGSRIEARWHSFGKSSNPVTIGTLMHYAEQAGWQEPVTFSGDVPDFTDYAVDIDAATVDLLRPPGFVGDLVQWINSRSLFPRETLAVAAALMVVSNCAGMRYRDPLDNSAFNLFCFGVADSSTGKEAILQAHNELLKAAGISAALVGGIKSEQEIYRNLIRHQAAYYSIDELGEHFAKISSAQKRGGAVYLEGVIGTLMNIYSKANSFVAITGDLKEEVRQSLVAERTRLQKAVDANEDKNGRLEARLARVGQSLSTIDMGIEHPFLSIFGLTTPEKFNNLMDFELVANGFMGRALIFQELEKNPRIKPRDKRSRQEVPDRIKYTLQNLYAPGYFDAASERVERIGDKSDIQTTAEAVNALDDVSERFWEIAAQHAESTGMQAIPRRGYELVAKVSAVLAIPSGLRTLEHVQWAYKLVRRDIEGKMKLAYSNSAPDKGDALFARILSLVTTEHGETVGSLCNQCRAYKKEQVREAVDRLVKSGHLIEAEHKPQRGPVTKKIMLAK
jgi:hypothetical protein